MRMGDAMKQVTNSLCPHDGEDEKRPTVGEREGMAGASDDGSGRCTSRRRRAHRKSVAPVARRQGRDERLPRRSAVVCLVLPLSWGAVVIDAVAVVETAACKGGWV